MNFIELYEFVKKFLNDDVISTEDAHRLVEKLDSDSNGKITYREVIVELGDHVDTVAKVGSALNFKVACGGVVALLVACVVFLGWKLFG